MSNTELDYISIRVAKTDYSNLCGIYNKWVKLCDEQSALEVILDDINPEHISIMSSIEADLVRHMRLFEVASRVCLEFAVGADLIELAEGEGK
jgi:hypothetical protein